jgi:E3 ubiquitin-protein ligase TRIP12
LQAFEKISLRQPTPCLQAGMITAVLAYIDFFAASIQVSIAKKFHLLCRESTAFANWMRASMFQRVAVSAVANVCKKIPLGCSQFVIDSVPMLCNLLQSEDKMVFLVTDLTHTVLGMYMVLC